MRPIGCGGRERTASASANRHCTFRPAVVEAFWRGGGWLFFVCLLSAVATSLAVAGLCLHRSCRSAARAKVARVICQTPAPFPPPLVTPTLSGWPPETFNRLTSPAPMPAVRSEHSVSRGRSVFPRVCDRETGVGKTTLLETLIRHDIAAGAGCALIDPHGDFVERVAARVPAHRKADIVYLNVTDPAQPYGYNPISRVSPERRSLVASGLMEFSRSVG